MSVNKLIIAGGVLCILVLSGIGVYLATQGHYLECAVNLLMSFVMLSVLVNQYAQKYSRLLAVPGALVLLILAIVAAFEVQNVLLQTILLLVAAAWSIITVIVIYSVLLKKRQPSVEG